VQLALELVAEMSFRQATKILGYIVPAVSNMGVWVWIYRCGGATIPIARVIRYFIPLMP